jgi:Subtilase family
MLRGARSRSGRGFCIPTLFILGLAVTVFALEPASDAAARPHHARKAAKPAPWSNAGPLAKRAVPLRHPAATRATGWGKETRAAGWGKGMPARKDTALSNSMSKSHWDRRDRHRLSPHVNRSAAAPRAGHFSRDHQQRFRIEHRRSIVIARSRLPFRPFPGQRGFTGVPPAGESRFVSNELVFQVGANVSQQAIDAAARRHGLSTMSSDSFGLTGRTLINFRIADGRRIADVVRALEAENIGVAQPNYVFTLQRETRSAARAVNADANQYVVSKLRLAEVHRVATGSNVVVAVIDSEIDAKHPDLDGAIVERFDAVGRRGQPHAHGTGMAGAIAARRQLTGVAPSARILAIHAFSPETKEAPQATTRQILAGLEWAIKKGARVVNMSFAGPYDPLLQLAMKQAHDKGVVLIAAAGNMGPNSPPLFPAADPHVIAVTATDRGDKLFVHANQGAHVAVSAPGVDILEPAPNAGYQLTTGTSVAAAHVSGIAALLIERDPSLGPAAIHEILTSSAKDVGSQGRDDRFGWGLVDPSRALLEVDAKIAQDRGGAPAKPAISKPGPVSSR